jgi:hypothetical protein
MTELSTHVGSGLTWDNINKLIVNSNTGNVVGPGSATDNAVARFDATTGKLLQNSVVTIGDTGNVAGVGTLASGTQTVTGDINVSGLVDGVDIATLSAFMPQVRLLSSTVNSTSTTTAAVAGLTFSSLVAGSYLYFFGLIASTAASTTGYKTSVSYSGTTGTAAQGVMMPSDDGTGTNVPGYFGYTSLGNNPSTGNLTGSFDVLAIVTGSFVATGSGDFALKWGTEVAGSTASLNAGSYGFLLRAS